MMRLDHTNYRGACLIEPARARLQSTVDHCRHPVILSDGILLQRRHFVIRAVLGGFTHHFEIVGNAPRRPLSWQQTEPMLLQCYCEAFDFVPGIRLHDHRDNPLDDRETAAADAIYDFDHRTANLREPHCNGVPVWRVEHDNSFADILAINEATWSIRPSRRRPVSRNRWYNRCPFIAGNLIVEHSIQLLIGIPIPELWLGCVLLDSSSTIHVQKCSQAHASSAGVFIRPTAASWDPQGQCVRLLGS